MASNRYVAYIGTYTREKSKGIQICDVNVQAGTLTKRKEVEAANPAYLYCAADVKKLYAISDTGIACFKIKEDGDLELVSDTGIDALRPHHISSDSKGRFLFAGGYHDAKVSVIRLERSGKPGAVKSSVFHKGFGTAAERTFTPHVTCVLPTPDDRFLCAVDNGTDRVVLYRLEDSGVITAAGTVHCQPGSAPKMMLFGNKNKNAYILSDKSNTVDVYEYHANGADAPSFRLIQTVETASDKIEAVYDAAADMCFSPDGKYLFASTAGDNTVTMYAINPEDGSLSREFSLPISGAYPRSLALFPGGRHLACVNYESDSVTTFTVDYEKKTLVMKGRPLQISCPTCIRILRLPQSDSKSS